MLPETELLIRNPSQEIVKEAILTVPGRVLDGELTFAASGLAKPEKEDEIPFYVRECQRLGIIPGTYLCYEYTYSPNRAFRLRPRDSSQFPALCLPEKEQTEKLLLKGGRIHLFTFKLRERCSPYDFELLRDYLLEELLRSAYLVSSGRLELAGENRQNAQLIFGRSRSIRLLQEEEYQGKLQVWFANLAQQNAGQLRLLRFC